MDFLRKNPYLSNYSHLTSPDHLVNPLQELVTARIKKKGKHPNIRQQGTSQSSRPEVLGT